MYSPAHYAEDRPELILEVIRRYNLATMITQAPGGAPFISHLPLLLDEGGQFLLGHSARANPSWRHFADGQTVTAIFHGPNAYVSPAWYQPKSDNVPTWNYVAVHVKGVATVNEEPLATYQILQTLSQHFETYYGTRWSLPSEPNTELMDLLKHIVAFRLEIKEVQAKFKLSQKQSDGERTVVMRELPKVAGSMGEGVSDFMARVVRGKRGE